MSKSLIEKKPNKKNNLGYFSRHQLIKNNNKE